VLGDDGLRLRTIDGGEVWREVVQPGEPELGPGFGDVSCLPDGSGRCWSIGGAIRYTRDGGASWHRAAIESPVEFAPLEFGFGRVELSDGERDRLLRFVDSLRARRDLQWRIEAGASAREIERILRQRDPMAALELIETRAQEVLSQIEEAGVAPERITLVGAPPWDYEDYLDDDPEFLDRYWIAHTFPRPGVRVEVAEAPVLAAIRVRDAATGFAIGRDGVVLRSEEQGRRWRQADRFTVYDLFGLAFGRRRTVAVGAQGGVWLGGGDDWSWSRPDPGRLTPFFETLRSVDFSPSGGFGMIVGSGGRILRSLDGGQDWTLLAPDDRS
jgi:hypothetical protein